MRLSAVLIAVALVTQSPAALRYDVIVRNGTVLDGTGGSPFRADVGVIGKHIARVGDRSSAEVFEGDFSTPVRQVQRKGAVRIEQ